MAEGATNSGRSFSTFVWDSEKREVLGQQRSTCLKVLIGLLILVVVVAAIVIPVVLSLNAQVRPGLSFEPNEGDNLVYIRRGPKYNDSFTYSTILDSVVDDYDKKLESEHVVHCSESRLPEENTVCVFDPRWIGQVCQPHAGWGYGTGDVCIFLTPNLVPGWVPEPYETIAELPADMPRQLKDNIRKRMLENLNQMPKMLWVSCDGQNPADREYMGEVIIGPWNGFPLYYFPYQEKLKDMYMPPIVAFKIKPQRNVLVVMECRLWAKNIGYKDEAASILIEILHD